MRNSLLFLLALLALPRGGEAQDTASVVHGFAFTRRPLLSADQYGDCIHLNDRRCLRATREEILKTVQIRHPGIGTIEALEAFVRSLVSVDCPDQTVSLARLLISSRGHREVDALGWKRPLRKDEVCLGDPNTGLVEFSLWCGNPLGEEVSFRRGESPVQLPVSPSAPAERKVDTVYLKTPIRRDTIRVRVYGDSIVLENGRNVLETGWMSFSNHDMFFEFIGAKKKSNALLLFGTHILAAGGGFLLGTQVNSCQVVRISNGGPVNPPNRIVRFGVRFPIP